MESSVQSENVKVVYAGKLIDSVSERVRTNVSIVVADGRIREVREGKAAVSGAEVIDLSECTVMPGFIDCHTHLVFRLDKGCALKYKP